jgi:hypothetical protein
MAEDGFRDFRLTPEPPLENDCDEEARPAADPREPESADAHVSLTEGIAPTDAGETRDNDAHQIEVIAATPIAEGACLDEEQRSRPAAEGMSAGAILTIVGGVLAGAAITFALLLARGSSTQAVSRVDGATPAGSAVSSRSTASTSTPAFRQKWNSANRIWVGGQRNAAAFELLSETKVQVWQRQAQPILVVRCLSKRLEAFVFIESAAQIESGDGNHTVKMGFDNGAETTERWADSDEHDALFAPHSEAFVGRLTRASSLTFSYTPHNAAPVTTSFHVSGLADLLRPVAKQCSWKN